jgi:hypothetical protein
MGPRELEITERGAESRSTPEFLQGWSGSPRDGLTS